MISCALLDFDNDDDDEDDDCRVPASDPHGGRMAKALLFITVHYEYQTARDELRQLLHDGWWGVARTTHEHERIET